MYLFYVNGNLAYGKMGLLNFRVYMCSLPPGEEASSSSFFFKDFLPLATLEESFATYLSILSASISALVLLFFLAGVSVAESASTAFSSFLTLLLPIFFSFFYCSNLSRSGFLGSSSVLLANDLKLGYIIIADL